MNSRKILGFVTLALVVFFLDAVCAGCGADPAIAVPATHATTQYSDWFNEPIIWTEVQEDGSTVAWVKGWASMLLPDNPGEFKALRDATIKLAKWQAVDMARKHLRLAEFTAEFDEPVTAVTSDSICVLVRMRVDLDSAESAPPPPPSSSGLLILRAAYTCRARLVFAQHPLFLYSFSYAFSN